MKKSTNRKIQCDLNRETANMSALFFDNIDKDEYLAGQGLLPLEQIRIIQQV